jgi:hypothetical protein
MMSEQDVRSLHQRIVKALAWAQKHGGFSKAQLQDLVALRIQLDWLLEVETKLTREWAAGIVTQLHNVESLKRSYEASEGMCL